MTNSLHTAASDLIADMAPWRVLQVASLGYRGALPEGVSEGDDAGFRAAVQALAKVVEATVAPQS